MQKIYRLNNRITAPLLRIIDEEGEHLGVMPTSQALNLAQERGYDLVEVSPLENPPVAKFLDFGQFKYELEKKERLRKAKAPKIKIKGIRLSLRIAKGDLVLRKNQALEFLKSGNKVKIELILKGRERLHLNLAKEIFNNFTQSLKEEINLEVEQPLTIQGGRLTTIVKRV